MVEQEYICGICGSNERGEYIVWDDFANNEIVSQCKHNFHCVCLVESTLGENYCKFCETDINALIQNSHDRYDNEYDTDSDSDDECCCCLDNRFPGNTIIQN